MKWIEFSEHSLPKPDDYYFVWIPEWEGYGNEAHGDTCFWDGKCWQFGNFPSVEDGAPVSHWATIEPPNKSLVANC